MTTSKYFDQLLGFDPLKEAEEFTGKSVDDDRRTTGLGMQLAMAHNKLKQEELGLRDDTHYNSSYNDYRRILEELGFEEIYSHDFMDTHYPQRREAWSVWQLEGLILTLESYSNRTTVNSARLYFNLELSKENISEVWKLRTSGGFVSPLYEEGRYVWAGDVDVRQALRHQVDTLDSTGDLLSEWVERPSLWFLDYSQTKAPDYDASAITDKVISQLPEAAQTVIGPPRSR